MAHVADIHDEHHYHPPGLQHQFEDMGQQQESASIGMWMFLVQEIMFFGGLFTVYLVFRSKGRKLQVKCIRNFGAKSPR